MDPLALQALVKAVALTKDTDRSGRVGLVEFVGGGGLADEEV